LSGFRSRRKRINGHNRQDRKKPRARRSNKACSRTEKEAEVRLPPPQSLLALRSSTGVPAQVWHLPFMLPATGAERRSARRGEGKLVTRLAERRYGKHDQ